MVRFSIIIPTYNGIRHMKPCLDSILSQDYPDFELIVVDNASMDGTVEFIRTHYPSVRIVENHQNRGYAGGCNDGYRVSHGEYILMLNSDTVLFSTCLSELDRSISSYPLCGMYAPKILYPDGTINAAGSEASLSGSAWERGKGEKNGYNTPCEVFGPHGAAALFSREVIEITGGFDEDFFLFVEETDLAYRARLAGYSCRYVPGAVIYHYHGGTVQRRSDLALYYLHRNAIWYVIKDFPFPALIFSLPLIFGRNVLVILYYILKGQGTIIIKAKRDAIRGLPRFIRKRKEIFMSPGKIHLHMHLINPNILMK